MNKTIKGSYEISIEGLKRLREIEKEEIDEEDEIIKPSEYAYKNAYELIEEIYEQIEDKFPYCACSLETRGGIDLVWDNPGLERRVWVEIDREEGGYIFYRERGINGLIKHIDKGVIKELLIWLNEN